MQICNKNETISKISIFSLNFKFFIPLFVGNVSCCACFCLIHCMLFSRRYERKIINKFNATHKRTILFVNSILVKYEKLFMHLWKWYWMRLRTIEYLRVSLLSIWRQKMFNVEMQNWTFTPRICKVDYLHHLQDATTCMLFLNVLHMENLNNYTEHTSLVQQHFYSSIQWHLTRKSQNRSKIPILYSMQEK